MDSVICNIPHSSLHIPEWALKDFVISRKELKAFSEKIVDLHVDELFDFVDDTNKISAELSRVVLDVERFREDAKEEMSKLGMGLYYEKDDLGRIIRHRGKTYEDCLIYYDKYHDELTEKAGRILSENGSCYILDCHSFHEGLAYTGFPVESYPDVCIGVNKTTLTEVKELKVYNLFKDNGYSIKVNEPFSGALVPLAFGDNENIHSLMLELNRRIYCGNAKDFERVKHLCREVYAILNE